MRVTTLEDYEIFKEIFEENIKEALASGNMDKAQKNEEKLKKVNKIIAEIKEGK